MSNLKLRNCLQNVWQLRIKCVKDMKGKENLRNYYRIENYDNQRLCRILDWILEQKKDTFGKTGETQSFQFGK